MNTLEEVRMQGYIYFDSSSKGNGRKAHRWCAEIMIEGKRYRHRSSERADVEDWLETIVQGRRRADQNYDEWLKAWSSQAKYAQIEVRVKAAAEEARMLQDYHERRDFTLINGYAREYLIPHLMAYCVGTLHVGGDTAREWVHHAIALLYTRIAGDVVVPNFTLAMKKMLRVRQQNASFFYYERLPEQVYVALDRIDFDSLCERFNMRKKKK